MIRHIHYDYFHGKAFFPGVLLIAICLTVSCKQRGVQKGMDESAFVFETSNIKGDEADYSRPAVITGHISHRELYPKTTEISIVIPFYDRVSEKQSSTIYEDSFAFSFVPYAPRTISMSPYIDHLVVCPGDSIHVELDFADLGKVVYSGKGAKNNENLNDFFVRYYLKDWPGFSEWELDSEGEPVLRKYKHADAFVDAIKQKLESHLARLNEFIQDTQPSPELIALCRKEIEADYYSELIQGLLGYKDFLGENVSARFQVKDAEPLFSEDCMSGNLFELSSNIATWLFSSLDRKEVLRLANDYAAQGDFLKQATKNDMLRQMLITHLYNQLLEANEVDRFEDCFANFNENVTYPLLKLSTRDRYVLKKAWQENPRALSEAILNADKPRDGQAIVMKENEGLKLLRSVIAQEEKKVVYVTIGATWCPASRQELPFQQSLAADEKGKPLRVVNFWLDSGADDLDFIALGIENYHLTDAQRAGLDPILHLGRGIPFYILIDKEGVIVDFGEYLRPSIPETRTKIEAYLGQ
ncbi:MAG: TlpA family protein disulfide reductase [Fibrobacter sp.]|nr:TlpA family protein disulfide reductase [Fibrobacter sp.]